MDIQAKMVKALLFTIAEISLSKLLYLYCLKVAELNTAALSVLCLPIGHAAFPHAAACRVQSLSARAGDTLSAVKNEGECIHVKKWQYTSGYCGNIHI